MAVRDARRGRGGNGGGGGAADGEGVPPWIRFAPFLVIVAVALYLVTRGYFIVGPTEKAVVLRFGRVHEVVDSGLHFLVPWIDQALKVDVADKSIRLPFGDDQQTHSARRGSVDENDGLMLTGELNSAVVEWDVQYRVRDAKKFLFQIETADVQETIRSAAQTVMHRLVGDSSLDEALVGRREAIALEARIGLQALLDRYESGVEVAGLQMQRITPPASVRPAYDAVNSAMQTREQLVNEAQKIRNQILPKAQSERDRMIQEAKGYADAKRLTIDGEVAALQSQYVEYKAAPEIVRQRLYLETMEHVLQNVGSKVIVDERLRQVVPILPLAPGAGPQAVAQ